MKVKRLASILHWLNVDTALGATITSLFIAKNLEVSIPPIAAFTLLIAVLTIYNFDHLIDAKRLNINAGSARHRFYQRNLKVLAVYQLFLLFILLTIIWYLPFNILRAGIILGLTTAIYFLLLFIVFPNRFILKEVLISVVFTTALFLAPIYSGTTLNLTNFTFLLWMELLVLAIANTLVFAWYDHDQDEREGHVSLARVLGPDAVYTCIIVLLILLGLLFLLQIYLGANIFYQSVILMMGIILLGSLVANKGLAQHEIYRVSGEAIFLLPLVALF